MKKIIFIGLLVMAIALPMASQAISKNVMLQMGPAQEVFSEVTKDTSEACESNISSEIIWDNFDSATKFSNHSSGYYCSAGLSAIKNLCDKSESSIYKAYRPIVQSKIQNYRCEFGPERKAELVNGTFVYTVNFDSANDQYFVREYLTEALLK